MSDWPTTALCALLEEPVRNGIYKPKEYHGRGAKIVNMGELFGHPRLRGIDMKRVELSESEIDRFGLAVGDLIFARRSLTAEGAGKCSIVLDVKGDTAFESSIIRARINHDLADPLFLFYFFSSPSGHHQLDTIRRQVAVAGITGSDLSKLHVPTPSIDEQRAIASVLGALDDKIELNRRMNETLEAMARAIFKDWFVDFGPTRAKIEGRPPYLAPEIWSLFPDRLDDEGKPEGWATLPLGALAKVDWGNTNLTKRSYVETGYPAFSAAGQDGFVEMPERNGLGVVISAIGTVGKIYLASGGWTAIKNTLIVQGVTDALSAFVYYLLLETPLPTRGSTQQFISLGDAKATKVLSPDHNSIFTFHNLVEPLIKRMAVNNDESRALAATRDFLLPKLMSGEVRIRDAEALLEGIR